MINLEVIIDRILQNYAVLLPQPDEEEEIHWPAKYLPEDAREGSLIKITLGVDHTKTKERKKRAKNLIQKLKKKDL